MPNITLSVDPEVVRKVRRIALDRHTTLTAMVRGYLESVARAGAGARQARVQALRDSFAARSQDRGVRTWTRDDLHER